MALPLIVAAATKLGIEVAKYIVKKKGKKVLKDGAAGKLRKAVANKKKVDSGLSINKSKSNTEKSKELTESYKRRIKNRAKKTKSSDKKRLAKGRLENEKAELKSKGIKGTKANTKKFADKLEESSLRAQGRKRTQYLKTYNERNNK